MTRDDFKRVSRTKYGPGGYKCRCCGPSPKDRPRIRRMVRRKLKQADQQLFAEGKDDLIDEWWERELNCRCDSCKRRKAFCELHDTIMELTGEFPEYPKEIPDIIDVADHKWDCKCFACLLYEDDIREIGRLSVIYRGVFKLFPWEVGLFDG